MSVFDSGAVTAADDDPFDNFWLALAAAFPHVIDELLRAEDELATARAQRNGLQRALDKANRDNDVLRAELRQLGVESQPTAATVSKLLVDRGEGDYSWVEEPASGGGEGEGGSALSVRRPLDLSLDFDEIQRAIDKAMDKAKAIAASMTGGL